MATAGRTDAVGQGPQGQAAVRMRGLRMKFLIIGANGQVGYELQRSLAPLGSVTAIDYPEINIADVDALRQYVRSQAPDVLVNAAAYTAVDKAEAEESVALAVNGSGVATVEP